MKLIADLPTERRLPLLAPINVDHIYHVGYVTPGDDGRMIAIAVFKPKSATARDVFSTPTAKWLIGYTKNLLHGLMDDGDVDILAIPQGLRHDILINATQPAFWNFRGARGRLAIEMILTAVKEYGAGKTEISPEKHLGITDGARLNSPASGSSAAPGTLDDQLRRTRTKSSTNAADIDREESLKRRQSSGIQHDTLHGSDDITDDSAHVEEDNVEDDSIMDADMLRDQLLPDRERDETVTATTDQNSVRIPADIARGAARTLRRKMLADIIGNIHQKYKYITDFADGW